MEHVDELGTRIEGLIRAAKSRQEIALADYRTAIDEERAAKRLQAEHKELERIVQNHHEAKMAEAYSVQGIRR